MNQELTIKEHQEEKRAEFNLPVQQPRNILEYAIEKDLTPEKIEKFWEIQKKIDADNAIKAFIQAKADFNTEPIQIVKDKVNKQFGSKYSSIEAIVNAALPYLGKHGFSHRWSFDNTVDKLITVTCILTHREGHSEAVSMSGPLDTSGGNSKNDLQKIKSTHTYLKIATFEAVTGLVSSENNLSDDGNSSGSNVEYVTEEEQANIESLITEVGADRDKFLAFLKIGDICDIQRRYYKKTIGILEAKRGK